MKKLLATLVAAIGLASGTWAYENDGPGYDSTAPKRARLLTAQSDTSFAPPEASDICFVATKGGDIGVEVWGNGSYSYRTPRGSITIPLPINRYFGNKQKLIESEALPRTAKLTMVVWDVDNESSYTPAEYDEIFFNDNPPIDKKTLYGVNNGLKRNEFIINIDAINLPENPGETANNTIRIDVATKGGDWVTRIDWVALEIPAAPPVILAHGINSNKGTMQDHIGTLIEERLGLPVYSLAWPNHGNNHISDYGTLAKYIDAYKKVCKVDHVNIVAHSMGGLRARGYAENAKDVLRVLQLGSPNGGSPFANYLTDDIDRKLAAIEAANAPEAIKEMNRKSVQDEWGRLASYFGQDLDPYHDAAIRCLRTDFMEDYNKYHNLNPLVDYSVLAGRVTKSGWIWESGTTWWGIPLYDSMYIVIDLVDPNLHTDGDMIVSVASAHTKVPPLAGSPIEDRFAIAWHCGLTDEGADTVVERMRQKLVAHKTMKDVERFRGEISGNTKSFVANGSNAKRMVRNVSSQMAGTCKTIYRDEGFAQSGDLVFANFCAPQDAEVTVLISTLDEAASLENLRIIAPSGLTPDPTTIKQSMTNLNNSVAVTFVSNESGLWKIGFIPTGGTMSSALWSIVVSQDCAEGGLCPMLEERSVNVNEKFVLTVAPSYQNQGVSGNGSVVVRNPLGEYSKYELSESINGYHCEIVATIPGQYTFQVSFLGQTAPVCATESLIGTAVASSSSFKKEVSSFVEDSDGNGLYDNLIVNFAVDATAAGTYRVLATLADTAGNEITEGWTSNIVCSVGTHMFPVAFDGRAIYGNGECGGYVVSSVKLLEIGDDYEAVIDERSDCFTTTAYTYRQFEHSLVAMLSGGNDTPTDADGDGIYDKLYVTIPLYADDLVAGTYEWSASLENAEGSLLGTASGSVTFSLGTGGAPINMSFAGAGFSATDLDGPFYVKSLILWGNGRTFTISSEYATQPYSIKQWGGTPRHKPRYDFVEKTFSSNEGEKLVVTIAGGDEEGPCSLQVYLTYNTAAAADLDLAKGSVDGVTPKGGLKFPLTVSWAAGETGAKTIEIPVKADTTFEADEFFTLQLANPSGMALGDFRVCTATIHDRNTKVTLADAINNQSLKPSTSGAGKWLAVESWATDPDETNCAAFVESPAGLLAGKTATLSFGTQKGAGTLSFDMKFVGDDVGGASFVEVYEGKTLLKTFTMSGNGAGWKSCQVSSSTSGSRALSIVMTQGADLTSRVRITNVAWKPSTSSTFATLRMEVYPAGAGFASGSGTYVKGSKVNLTATPRPGHTFVGWYLTDGSLFSSKAKTTGTLNGNAGLIALFSRDPYVRGLADPASAGKVAGSGLCASGKKVTLKATANKGFVFEGWYNERDVRLTQAPSLLVDNSAKPAKPSATTYVISNCVSDVTYYARFVTVEEDKASISCSVGDMEFPAGSSKPFDAELPCGVWVDWPVVSAGLSQTTVKVSGLPGGLKYNAKTGSIEGAPNAPSKKNAKTSEIIPSVVKITVTTAGKSKKDLFVNLTITEMPSAAVGTFSGFVSPYDSDANEFYRALSTASFTLTSTAAGKITVKTVSPKKTVSFSANYWNELDDGFYSTFLSAKTGEMLYLYVNSEPQYWNGSNHAFGYARGGSFGTEWLYAEAQRSSFLKSGKDYEHPEAIDLAKGVQGTYKFDATYKGDGEYELVQSADKKATLSVAIKNTGAVTVAGTLPGTSYKVSGSSVLRVYPSSSEADIFVCGASGKTVNVMVLLRATLGEDGKVAFTGSAYVNAVK